MAERAAVAVRLSAYIAAALTALVWAVALALGMAPYAVSAPIPQAAPIGNLDDRQAWAYDLVMRLGNTAPSAEMIAWLVAWQKAEDGGSDAIERNNPWNTSQPMPSSWTINDDGVRGYATYEDGMNATVSTIAEGAYADLLAGIQTNDPARALLGLYASPWGTNTDNVVSLYSGELQRLAAMPGAAPAAPQAARGAKSIVTAEMAVSAHFWDTGGVWCFQAGCQHWGTDYSGAEGTPVYAPFDLTVIALGEYPPGPTMGQYVQGTLPDGAVFYAGHLENRPEFVIGQTLLAGTLIGYTNSLAHTHIQLAPPGWTDACAPSGGCLNFEEYYATH